LFESDRFSQDESDPGHQASVQHTLTQLTEKNTEILNLRFFAEMSLDEISTTLELSLSATKMRLYRAMDAFKKKHSIENT